MYCIHCGNRLSDRAKFCPTCGKAQPSTATRPDAENLAQRPDSTVSEGSSHGLDGDLLSARQVADICWTTEPAVLQDARAGVIRAVRQRDQWKFEPADVRRYCELLRKNHEAQRSGVVPPPRPGRVKRAGTSTVGLINFLASLSALITVARTNQFMIVGLALAAFNGLLVVLNYLWNRGRLAAEAGAESASAAASTPSRASGAFVAGPLRWGIQLVLISATVGYIGLALVEDDAQALELSFNRSSALPGQNVFAQGEGFPPSTEGTLVLPDGSEYRFQTDEDGRFAKSFKVPDLGTGSHLITVTTDDGTSKSEILVVGLPTTPTEVPVATLTPVSTRIPTEPATEGPLPTFTEEPAPAPTDTPTASLSPTVTYTPTHVSPTPTFTPTPSNTPCDVDGCPPTATKFSGFDEPGAPQGPAVDEAVDKDDAENADQVD